MTAEALYHHPPDASSIVGKAFLRAAERLGISGKTLARIIGVSEPTMSRLKSGASTLEPDGKPFELALLLIRVYRSIDALSGGDMAVARAWLRNPNTALGGLPIERMQTIPGLIDVVAYLDSRRALV